MPNFNSLKKKVDPEIAEKADAKRELIIKTLVDDAIREVQNISDEDMINKKIYIKCKIKPTT